MSNKERSTDRPLQQFLNEELADRGLTSKRNDIYQKVVEDFKQEVLIPEETSPNQATKREVWSLIGYYRDDGIQDSTIQSRISPLNVIYRDLKNRGTTDRNPVKRVLDTDPFEIPDRDARDIDPIEMGAFIKNRCIHPLIFAVFVTFAKTGMRVGEVVNLDIRDVSLDHPLTDREYSNLRPQLEKETDTLYVTNKITEGQSYRGTVRKAGNKREKSTYIPVDEELKRALINYLSIRPPTSTIERPLFVGQGGISKLLNERLTPIAVQNHLRPRATEQGWWNEAYDEMNVTPHYFRHFFTTHASRRMDRSTVKYIRGDKGQDSMDTYKHDWGNELRNDYLSNIYKLF